jgi:superfamily II DNA or RNA helicase
MVTSLGSAKHEKEVKEHLKKIRLLFIDEGHHGKASTWYKLIMGCPAQFRFLLSGTPFTGDNDLMVEATCGPVIARVTNEFLIAQGISAAPQFKIIEVTEPDISDLPNLPWDPVYKNGIVLNASRNAAIVTEAAEFTRQGLQTLIVVQELWHGDLISSMLEAQGTAHDFVHGEMPSDWVQRKKSAFERREFPVLIASPIFNEGTDVPAIGALIMAIGGYAIRSILQIIGRGLRKKPGENKLYVRDFADLQHPRLALHSLQRLEIYAAEGFPVED